MPLKLTLQPILAELLHRGVSVTGAQQFLQAGVVEILNDRRQLAQIMQQELFLWIQGGFQLPDLRQVREAASRSSNSQNNLKTLPQNEREAASRNQSPNNLKTLHMTKQQSGLHYLSQNFENTDARVFNVLVRLGVSPRGVQEFLASFAVISVSDRQLLATILGALLR